MQMHRDQSERALELLYAAMRARDAAPAGSPAWRSADEQAQAIREAYLRAGPPAEADQSAGEDREADTHGAEPFDAVVDARAADNPVAPSGPADYWLVR